jgi:TRC40/GET3/ArsA family transport-energizing ATPase
MKRLAGKSLVIFAGKGGVGKTTCSAAMAMQFAKEGRRTLLVTVDPAMRLEDSLGVPLGGRETLVRPNLWASMLDPEVIIREKLAQYAEGARIMEHPMFRYVTNYLPGLNELMAIGKLNELRRESDYDVVVVDTAPTGHALAFLSAPRALNELMSERSLLRWAMRGYTLWLKFNKASRGIGRLFGSGKEKEGRKEATEEEGKERLSDQLEAAKAEEVDIEAVFRALQAEAAAIEALLTDPKRTAINIVTLPEKLPVEETVDLYAHAVDGLGIHLGYVIVNKVQPDALGPAHDEFLRLLGDKKTRAGLTRALQDAGYPADLLEALCLATEFNDLRLRMNLNHIAALREHLPRAVLVLMPLFKEDVAGLEALERFRDMMYRLIVETG